MNNYLKGYVAVIIPCYNGAPFLESCLKSILIQTYSMIEVIIVNDGSTDESESIILSYKKEIEEKGYFFTYIKQKNEGAAGAVNKALKQVKSEFIMLYDVDDFLMKDAIKIKAEFLLKNKEYGMVRSNGYYVSPDDLQNKSKLFTISENEMKNEHIFDDILFERTYNWPSTFMVRTECLFKHLKNKSIYVSKYGQNMQIMLPVAYHYRSSFINIPLTRYLIRNGSVSHSSSIERNLELQNGFYKNRIEIIKQLDIPDKIKKEYIEKVDIYYLKRKIAFGCEYKQKDLLKTEYKKLKKINSASKKDTVYYLLGVVPGLHVFYGVAKWIYHKKQN
ncbi:MAG: glycosyltransferase family A protein [bacterium]|nr:glycosyltransferase family A protein [bacterium]